MKELEQLERQLEGSLKHIRSTKVREKRNIFPDGEKNVFRESFRPFRVDWDTIRGPVSMPYEA